MDVMSPEKRSNDDNSLLSTSFRSTAKVKRQIAVEEHQNNMPMLDNSPMKNGAPIIADGSLVKYDIGISVCKLRIAKTQSTASVGTYAVNRVGSSALN